MTYPDGVRRAGYADGNELFDAILASPSGVVFTRDEYGDDFARIIHPDKRIAVELPEMLAELDAIDRGPVLYTSDRFPIVLSVRASGGRSPPTTSSAIRPGASRDADGRLPPERRGCHADRGERRRPGGDQHENAAAPKPWSRSAPRCKPGTPRCRTASGSSTAAPTATRSSPGSPPNSLTLLRLARRVRRYPPGTSTYLPGSSRPGSRCSGRPALDHAARRAASAVSPRSAA